MIFIRNANIKLKYEADITSGVEKGDENLALN